MKKRIELLKQIRNLPLHTRPIMTDEYFDNGGLIDSQLMLQQAFTDRRRNAILDYIESHLGETIYAAIANDEGPINQFLTINGNVINEITILSVVRNVDIPSVSFVIGDSNEETWANFTHIIVGEYENVKKAIELERELVKEDEEQGTPIFKLAE